MKRFALWKIAVVGLILAAFLCALSACSWFSKVKNSLSSSTKQNAQVTETDQNGDSDLSDISDKNKTPDILDGLEEEPSLPDEQDKTPQDGGESVDKTPEDDTDTPSVDTPTENKADDNGDGNVTEEPQSGGDTPNENETPKTEGGDETQEPGSPEQTPSVEPDEPTLDELYEKNPYDYYIALAEMREIRILNNAMFEKTPDEDGLFAYKDTLAIADAYDLNAGTERIGRLRINGDGTATLLYSGNRLALSLRGKYDAKTELKTDCDPALLIAPFTEATPHLLYYLQIGDANYPITIYTVIQIDATPDAFRSTLDALLGITPTAEDPTTEQGSEPSDNTNKTNEETPTTDTNDSNTEQNGDTEKQSDTPTEVEPKEEDPETTPPTENQTNVPKEEKENETPEISDKNEKICTECGAMMKSGETHLSTCSRYAALPANSVAYPTLAMLGGVPQDLANVSADEEGATYTLDLAYLTKEQYRDAMDVLWGMTVEFNNSSAEIPTLITTEKGDDYAFSLTVSAYKANELYTLHITVFETMTIEESNETETQQGGEPSEPLTQEPTDETPSQDLQPTTDKQNPPANNEPKEEGGNPESEKPTEEPLTEPEQQTPTQTTDENASQTNEPSAETEPTQNEESVTPVADPALAAANVVPKDSVWYDFLHTFKGQTTLQDSAYIDEEFENYTLLFANLSASELEDIEDALYTLNSAQGAFPDAIVTQHSFGEMIGTLSVTPQKNDGAYTLTVVAQAFLLE